MMFGDMGHGSVLTCMALALVFGNNYFKGGIIPNELLRARYLLLLMGIMAFYCGHIYNEFFAITTNIYGSCYEMNKFEAIEF